MPTAARATVSVSAEDLILPHVNQRMMTAIGRGLLNSVLDSVGRLQFTDRRDKIFWIRNIHFHADRDSVLLYAATRKTAAAMNNRGQRAVRVRARVKRTAATSSNLRLELYTSASIVRRAVFAGYLSFRNRLAVRVRAKR